MNRPNSHLWRLLAILCAAVLFAAACGDDDSSNGSGGDGDDGDVEAPADSDAPAAQGGGDEFGLLAAGLHPGVEPAAPGTAVVRFADQEFRFDTLDQCEIETILDGRRQRFVVFAEGVTDDGDDVELHVLRTLIGPDETAGAGSSAEIDELRIQYQVDFGIGSVQTRAERREHGDAELLTGDELPFVWVVDDGGSLQATIVAEGSIFGSGLDDVAPTGPYEAAVHCG
jgi:hypothetical protein